MAETSLPRLVKEHDWIDNKQAFQDVESILEVLQRLGYEVAKLEFLTVKYDPHCSILNHPHVEAREVLSELLEILLGHTAK